MSSITPETTAPGPAELPPTDVRAAIAVTLERLTDREPSDAASGQLLDGRAPARVYDPSGPGRLLFAFLAAMAETERENLRESTLERLDAAARKGKHGGRPPVINIPRTAPIKLWERALARSPNTSLCSSSEPALAAGCGTGAGGRWRGRRGRR